MIGERKNRLYFVQLLSGLHPSRIFVTIYWMKLRKSIGIPTGGKQDFIIWSGTGRTGVFPDNVPGAFRYLFFMRRIKHRLLQMIPFPMFPTFSGNTAQMCGLKGKRRIYCRKVLHLNTVLTGNLRRKQILWMSGLTPVHLMRQS